ncbi:glycosyltransferase family 39 protein [Sphaerospermopsis aphanizomenoides BCCUSP55]|uniref:glycosyltransferase family 39 protein n=1 Tax=Sphaerospermopsis aphanizomenoides TaxID=459663 RepID=UPI000AB59595|nr:glycosyltransferase family 39 protein [Sphaerospermopsis aphanizomenoides]MBK1986282.1 glycosyltransferase family 39 protein [Sphaerospermopsis aphanizomenoides BCCUSP55]
MKTNLASNNLKQQLSLEKLALITIAIGVILRIINLGTREFWYDEVLSLLLSTSKNGIYKTPGDVPVVLAEYTSLLSLPKEASLGDFFQTIIVLIKSLLGGEPHPPIFFLSQHFWLRLFGNSEAGTRSLNTLFSIAAMGGAYGLGKLFLGHRGGLLFTALVAVSPFYLFHSLNVRMYAPLVLWAILSTWALLYIIEQKNSDISQSRRSQLLWNGLLIISITAGLMTFYLYAYWLIVLGVLVLYLDRRNWFQHGLRLGTGVLLTMPWVLWGTIKQLRNADLDRFGKAKSTLPPFLRHLQDFTNTLGTDILIGDWATSLDPIVVTLAGCLVILAFLGFSIHLWKQNEHKNLITVLILGILPISLALIVDIATKKFTLGFGFGRTMIIILPGCLLLISLWLEKAVAKEWRTLVAAGILLIYLTISIGDFSLRNRVVFRSVAELMAKDGNQPTLIAMNSKAWGHVMRVAYYIPSSYPVMLLSQKPSELANSLEKVLKEEPGRYSRIVWLNSANPLWSRLKTEAEVKQQEEKIQQVLSSGFKLQETQNLSGTMTLDNFTANLYTP